tara:strand:+ start:1815 stop:2237 length:423 start_codon:yes stop_codon:yes gene_type:complete
MEKFIKLFKSGTGQNKGNILIPVAGIMEIKQESDTVVNIFYAGNSTAQAAGSINYGADAAQTVPAVTNVVQAYKITHDAVVANSSSMKDWLNDAVEKSLQLSWQQPVYAPGGLPVSAASAYVAVTITAIELGVKAAGDVA